MKKPIELDIATFNRLLSDCGGDLAYMKAGIEQQGDAFIYGESDDDEGDDLHEHHNKFENAHWRFV